MAQKRSTCLQAMNTGHDGSLTTVHANSARDALHRLEMLVLMAGVELPMKAIREQIAGGFDLLIHISRLVDGSRRVTQITEIAGMEGDVVTLQDLFVAKAPDSQIGWDSRLLEPLAGHQPAARLPDEAQGERRRSQPHRLDRRSMKRVAFATLAAAVLLAVSTAAAAETPVQIRHVDFGSFPQLRITAIAPAGARPALFENGRPAPFVTVRQLASAEALVLAVDNSASMRGAPLHEAKRAARAFLAGEQGAAATGLVAFGHESLALTRQNETKADVLRTLGQLAPDPETGTSLYDAVISSVSRLERMSTGTRILVLLTDGHDVGSKATLDRAITAAQRASVVVYAIAAGAGPTRRRSREWPVKQEAGSSMRATSRSWVQSTQRSAASSTRTWQISYLTRARPGDSLTFRLQAGTATAVSQLRVPGRSATSRGTAAGFAHEHGSDGRRPGDPWLLCCSALRARPSPGNGEARRSRDCSGLTSSSATRHRRGRLKGADSRR